MNIESLMADAPDLAQTLAERIMTRKPDGSLSVRQTAHGLDVGEDYARHGLRVWRKLQGEADSVAPSAWDETLAWYRTHTDFVLALTMRVAAIEAAQTAANAKTAQSLQAQIETLQAENEALREDLADALQARSSVARERLEALAPQRDADTPTEIDTIRALQRRISELEGRLEAHQSASMDNPAPPLLTIAGSAAAGWLLGKALTTPTADPLR